MSKAEIYARGNAIENFNRKLRFSPIEKDGSWLNRSTKVEPCKDIVEQANQGKNLQTELFDSRFSIRCITLLFSLVKALFGKNKQHLKHIQILEYRVRLRLAFGEHLFLTIWRVLRDRKRLFRFAVHM